MMMGRICTKGLLPSCNAFVNRLSIWPGRLAAETGGFSAAIKPVMEAGKNVCPLAHTTRRAYTPKTKSLLLLFFRKEDLSFYTSRPKRPE
jgi:hypothetical protein